MMKKTRSMTNQTANMDMEMQIERMEEEDDTMSMNK